MSIDGADFRVPNHGPQFSSHKYNKKSALRYEVGLCILTGDIVWINGPYEAGVWPDISIFRDSLISFLEEYERVEADDGYIGEHPAKVKCPKGFANLETINKRFKHFQCFNVPWRGGNLCLHGDAFRLIAVVLQLSINNGEKLFECGYRDPPYGDEDDDDEDNDSDVTV